MKIQTGHFLKFQIGDIVYIKTDVEQRERMIVSIKLMCDNSVAYLLSHGTSAEWFVTIEITKEKDILKTFQ
jgi:hypothetical protein